MKIKYVMQDVNPKVAGKDRGSWKIFGINGDYDKDQLVAHELILLKYDFVELPKPTEWSIGNEEGAREIVKSAEEPNALNSL